MISPEVALGTSDLSAARTRATATNRRQTLRLVNTPLVTRAMELIAASPKV